MFTRNNKLIRPFSLSARVDCRGISLPLQKIITNFGADSSFKIASEKIKEHYGINVPISAVMITTENHARRIKENMNLKIKAKTSKPQNIVIAETDGFMLPTVSIDQSKEGDKRKARKLEWVEARTAIARALGSRSPIYSALIGSVDEAGNQLSDVVNAVGCDDQTSIHGVGDGAIWIYDQFEKQFGSTAQYLIDFYHLCEYLSAAAQCFTTEENRKNWFNEQKQFMKEGKIETVLKNLETHVNAADKTDHICYAAKCNQYIERRPGQFKYNEAIGKGLPIGSGEIESAHRHLAQKRLKISGAWWSIPNANNMLALRSIRVNGDWNSYWSESYSKEVFN